jgi:hypothetical protein
MCDDYDTDLDSEPDDFEKENLIDDIKRIQLALADSDAEEPSEDDEEEEENTAFIGTCMHRLYYCSRVMFGFKFVLRLSV